VSILGASIPFLLANPTPTVGFVQSGLTATPRSADNSSALSAADSVSCSAPQRIGVLRFGEIFGSAFKARTFATFVNGDTSPAPLAQNVTGTVSLNETDFYNP